MSKTKILFVSHEMNPFLEISNIANITRQLPQAMQEKGFEIRILIPRFGVINERRNRLHEVIRLSGMNITVNEMDLPLLIKVASLQTARMQVYFLDNEDYFQRKYIFRDKDENFYTDNDERMIFFCKGALETVKKLGWLPDIVHCHGFMSSLIPMYLKTAYKSDPMFKSTKSIYSIYENCFEEKMAANFNEKALSGAMKPADTELLKKADCGKLHMNAAKYADGIIIGSPKIDKKVTEYLKDIKTPILGYQNEDEYLETFASFYEDIMEDSLATA